MRHLTILMLSASLLACSPPAIPAPLATQSPQELEGVPPAIRQLFGIGPAKKLTDEQQMEKGIREIIELTLLFCDNIYPKPTVKECIDKVKHGIGASADVHSEYLNANEATAFKEQMTGRFVGIGIEISRPGKTSPIFVISAIEDTPAHRAGLLAGDIITHVWKDAKTIVPTSSLSSMDEGVKMIRGEPGTSVKIRVTRRGVSAPLEFTIVRDVVKSVPVKGELVSSSEKTYALIRVKQFQSDVAPMVEAKFTELKKDVERKRGTLSGLILSFESNPGGHLHEAYNMIRLFDDAPGDIILIRSNEGIESYVPHPRQLLHRTPKNIAKGVPILVVVDGGSASASEVVAKALQHKGLAVVASPDESTFMKGIVQTVRPISETEAIKFTSSEYLIGSMTDWVPVQCIGVKPDIRFEYSGVKPRARLSECVMGAHVNTAGPMPNAPVHPPVKDANPALYQAASEMLEAYKQHRLPQLQAEEARLKALEETLNKEEEKEKE